MRLVCDYAGEGCAAKTMLHDSVRHRKAPKKKKQGKDDAKCTMCVESCLCVSEWVCKECRLFLGGVSVESQLRCLEFSLEELTRSPIDTTPLFIEPERARWLATLDCDYAAELRSAAALGARLAGIHTYFAGQGRPRWDRPPPAARELRAQYAQSALSATEKALGVLGSASVNAVYQGVKLAVSGYSMSQLFGDVVLSDEFKAAWDAALRQVPPRARACFKADEFHLVVT